MKNIKEAFPEFSKPSIAIDTVVLRVKNIDDKNNRTISRMQMQVLLVKKSCENQWHLPGTILRLGEISIDAINRIVNSFLVNAIVIVDIHILINLVNFLYYFII